MTEDQAAEIIWEYHLLHQELKTADVLLVFCSNDIRVAEYAAELWQKNLAPLLLVSGDGSTLLRDTHEGKTEAEVFSEILLKAGVPADKLLIENQANNTAENFTFSKALLKKNGFKVESAIIVQKPYMERRTFATGKVAWPELKQTLTSPSLTFTDYINGPIDQDTVINLMVGDLQRIMEYPKKRLAD